jgi:Na+/H+-dicarboxylate symporter
MFKNMPLFLVVSLSLLAIFSSIIPISLLSFLFAISLSIKSLIVCILPAIIFMLLFKTISQFSNKATKVIFFVLLAIVISNFISTLVSYFVGSSIYNLDISINLPKTEDSLNPSFLFTFPKWIGNDIAMFLGITLGILVPLFRPHIGEKITAFFDIAIEKLLKFILILIPPFVIGFVGKLLYDKVLSTILKDYVLIFALVAIAQSLYILFLYWISSDFNFKKLTQAIKNMIPALITGFGSMSSAAALPLTLMGTEKNTKGSFLSRLIIPTTVNIHLIGDCFAIPIFAFAVMKSFHIPEPSFFTYLSFAFYFVIAKFSVAAIPGGGIIVMLPILENILGFTPEMSSLITALYILFDPIITSANITGNGAFAMSLNKISNLHFFKKSYIIKKS